MLYVAGVDVGSTQAKAIVLDERARVVGEAILDVEMNMSTAAQQVFDLVVANANLSPDDIAFTVATGYGRYRVTFGDMQVTEISCHARGATAEFPKTRTVLDIGGQDTKAIRIGDAGEVVDFAMNDKC
ncbi:MAG TPA: BadF/BadG/BcrA/BcrD ATPase family protein, partial [Ktedonobacterales bacterium]